MWQKVIRFDALSINFLQKIIRLYLWITCSDLFFRKPIRFNSYKSLNSHMQVLLEIWIVCVCARFQCYKTCSLTWDIITKGAWCRSNDVETELREQERYRFLTDISMTQTTFFESRTKSVRLMRNCFWFFRTRSRLMFDSHGAILKLIEIIKKKKKKGRFYIQKLNK